MSDNDRSREGVSDKNCGTCRWAWYSHSAAMYGTCEYPMPDLPSCIPDDRVPIERTDGTVCPTWQAKEAAAKAEGER